MHTKEKTSSVVIRMIIAVIVAAYVLFPFILLLINSGKVTADITSNPVSLSGASFSPMLTNINAVINDPNFMFWTSFGSSALITVISLVLLSLFGAMAAWVICRNKTRWSTFIYFTFIASMIIPF